jgi:hypothetical protein
MAKERCAVVVSGLRCELAPGHERDHDFGAFAGDQHFNDAHRAPAPRRRVGWLWLAVGALLLTAAATARADEADGLPDEPCARAAALAERIVGAQEAELVVIAEAKPVCAERALAKRCAWYRVEIAGYERQIRELTADRKTAQRACAASRR